MGWKPDLVVANQPQTRSDIAQYRQQRSNCAVSFAAKGTDFATGRKPIFSVAIGEFGWQWQPIWRW